MGSPNEPTPREREYTITQTGIGLLVAAVRAYDHVCSERTRVMTVSGHTRKDAASAAIANLPIQPAINYHASLLEKYGVKSYADRMRREYKEIADILRE